MRPKLPKTEGGGRVQGLLQLLEDGIHLVVAALLVLFAGLLTVGVVHDVIRSIQGPYQEWNTSCSPWPRRCQVPRRARPCRSVWALRVYQAFQSPP
ncbi:hypothetical protein OG765_28950 [Streptomyces sp. NBC_00555]|uniref:hypothetical protein n=1 Tax=Streptomyces sp. NBC_00555 TaxID=2903662 RepID=UPI00224DF074|nr:hypothetical protein [Streptomyces sp. NBC_00555]MCX5014972.1 hypothetical protein [Streptomyces sp. NBC_00555]